MTVTAAQALNVARSQLGYREGNANRNKFGAWYGWNGVPWCMIFQSWVFAELGQLDLIGGKRAYCPWSVDWFKAHGRWGTTPRTGALVFFDWGSDRVADHVGILESTSGSHDIVIEGNTGDPTDVIGVFDGVFRRRRNRSLILGYGYPAYGTAARVVPAPRPRNGGVLVVPLVVDGEWGRRTTRRLQQFLHVPVDGVAGPVTVRALQRWVGVRQDGVLGRVTIRHLQARVGAAQDGVLGPRTVRALQRALNRAL